ncbi:MAG: hypothetical protein K8T25_18675 [Planctomycetia bacterium]|nr:hypothetical protein [Planctomycetia bacterium]
MSTNKLTIPGLLVVFASGLLSGCSQEVTQNDVNKKERDAAQAVAEADKKSDQIRHEARKEIVDVEQDRRQKVGNLEDKLQTTPENQPKVGAEISAANRDAQIKAEKIRENAAEKQQSVEEKAREKVEKANQTAAQYDAQQGQKQFVAVHEKLLADYDANIDVLRKHRGELGGDALKQFDTRLTRVDDGRKKAADALKQLKSARAEEWTTFRDEVQRSFAELKTAYEEARQS